MCNNFVHIIFETGNRAFGFYLKCQIMKLILSTEKTVKVSILNERKLEQKLPLKSEEICHFIFKVKLACLINS